MPSFFDLPPELRNIIYHFALDGLPKKPICFRHFYPPAISRVCRIIRSEMQPLSISRIRSFRIKICFTAETCGETHCRLMCPIRCCPVSQKQSIMPPGYFRETRKQLNLLDLYVEVAEKKLSGAYCGASCKGWWEIASIDFNQDIKAFVAATLDRSAAFDAKIGLLLANNTRNETFDGNENMERVLRELVSLVNSDHVAK